MTTLYVAGPMRGYPQFNYPTFAHTAERLRSVGLKVISPHEVDIDYGDLPGFNVNDPNSFTQAHWHTAMRRDLNIILNEVDGIATLEGWWDSKGAKAEVYVARTIGLPVRDWTHWYSEARNA